MKQSVFLNQVNNHISKTASKKNPNLTANAVYFIIKQMSINIAFKRNYVTSVKQIKTYLMEEFEWNMTEIHMFLGKLNKLLGYRNK